ncbi:MAG TPA: flavin reductase family protein [Erysipelothrix sp.]|nr:flavin reductase family protein [Erysipelothrix sp.]
MTKLHFDFSKINAKARLKLVQGSVIPRPIAWVSTRNENGTINLAPFSYFNMLTDSMVSISFQMKDQHHKDTYHNLLSQKQGVIHIVDGSLLEKMDVTGMPLERNQSELQFVDLNLASSQIVETPTIKEALISLEVKFEQEILLTSSISDDVDAHLVLLRVVGMSVDSSVFNAEKGYILADVLNPVARLAGPNYGKIVPIDYKRQY